MLGISVGFYISFSDSEETLKAFHKLIFSQSALLVTQMDYIEKKIGFPRDASYNVVQNNRIILVAEIRRLEIKINNLKNKMSIFLRARSKRLSYHWVIHRDMNGLIIYFSRTGRTRKVAEAIQEATGFDLEEIKEKAGRVGTLGFLKSGMESTRRLLPQIMPFTHDPSQYDIVIIGTPIWASNMSSPIRAFITEYKKKINQIALFCTGDGVDPEKVFVPISELLGKEPKATFGLIGPEREGEGVSLKIQEFAAKLKE